MRRAGEELGVRHAAVAEVSEQRSCCGSLRWGHLSPTEALPGRVVLQPAGAVIKGQFDGDL